MQYAPLTEEYKQVCITLISDKFNISESDLKFGLKNVDSSYEPFVSFEELLSLFTVLKQYNFCLCAEIGVKLNEIFTSLLIDGVLDNLKTVGVSSLNDFGDQYYSLNDKNQQEVIHLLKSEDNVQVLINIFRDQKNEKTSIFWKSLNLLANIK